MKQALISIVVAGLVSALAGAEETGYTPEQLQQRADESRAVAEEFGNRLKGELQAAIQAGGPVAALSVCKDKAPAITAEMSRKYGWKVYRTSLKPRNIAPDAWETRVLKEFDRRRADGEDPKNMEFFAVGDIDGIAYFRYMKALPTAPLCLSCHGKQIPEPVQRKLNELYPNDRAVGYEANEIRGGFSIIQPL